MGRTFHESKESLDLKASRATSASASPSPRFSVSRSCSPSSETHGGPEKEEAQGENDDGVEEIKRELAIANLFTTRASSPVGTLVDPIFQDLKPITRYYLDYCKSSCLVTS